MTDRPTSVRNRKHVIEVLVGVFVLTRCVLDLSVGVGAFAARLSQIPSSLHNYALNVEISIEHYISSRRFPF